MPAISGPFSAWEPILRVLKRYLNADVTDASTKDFASMGPRQLTLRQDSRCRLANFADEPAISVLKHEYSALQPFDFGRFTFEMEGALEEVQAVVSRVYGIPQ